MPFVALPCILYQNTNWQTIFLVLASVDKIHDSPNCYKITKLTNSSIALDIIGLALPSYSQWFRSRIKSYVTQTSSRMCVKYKYIYPQVGTELTVTRKSRYHKRKNVNSYKYPNNKKLQRKTLYRNKTTKTLQNATTMLRLKIK